MANGYSIPLDLSEAIKEIAKFTKESAALLKQVGEETKKIEKESKNAAKGIGKITDAAEGLFAAFLVGKLKDFFGGFIDSAQESLTVTKQLGFAFAAAGQDVDSGVKNISKFADELQKTTSLSDEFVISIAAQIQALKPLSTVQLKQATKAVLDFSAARGISAEAAAAAFAKGISGNTRSLLQYNIAVRKSSDENVQFQRVLAAFNENAGATDKTLGTFKGATQQLSNAYNEVQENIGRAILKSPELISLINAASRSFFAMADAAQSGVVPAIKGFLSVMAPLVQFILPALPTLLTAAAGAAIAFTAALGVGKIAALLASLNPMVLIFTAIGAAIALIVKLVLDLNAKFGSFGNSVKAIGIYVLDFFIQMQIAAKKALISIADLASGIPGVGKAFKESSKSASQGIEKLNARSAELNAELDKMTAARKIEIDAENAEKELDKVKDKQLKLELELITNVESQIKSLNDAVKNGNLTQRQIIEKEYKDRTALLKQAISIGATIEGGAANLRLKINQKYQADIAKLEEEAAAKRKQTLDSSSKDLTSFFTNFQKAIGEGASKNELLGAGISAAVGSISKGAEGARAAVVGVIGEAGKLLGPAGAAIGPLVDFLSQGPEKVKATIDAFISAIPGIIQNIILAIPALIMAIQDAMPLVIESLVASLPIIIDGLIESLPKLIAGAVMLMPKISTAFTIGLIKALPQLIDAFILLIPEMIYAFTTELINAAGDFVNSLWEAIKGLIPGGGALTKTAQGDFGGAISDTLSGIGDFFGFAEGGMVPAGYPNDSYPAKLTSGEAVLPTDTVQKLESFLANGGGGAGQNVTINLVVGEEQLAKVMLNLNRQGFRTS